MRLIQKLLLAVAILALLYGALLLIERLTTQELTRVQNPTTQQTVSLIWKPRYLFGSSHCELALLDPQDHLLDTAPLGTLDTAFNALQQYGQLSFEGDAVTVANKSSGQITHRFTIKDNHLIPAN